MVFHYVAMIPCFLGVLLIFLSFKDIITNAQPVKQIYFDDFPSQSDWKIENAGAGSIGVQWEDSGDSGRCNRLDDRRCLFIPGKGLVARVISSVSYHTLAIYIDTRGYGNKDDEDCYLQYRSISTSWTRVDLVTGSTGDEEIRIDIETIIPDTNDYNNQSSFELRLGHSGDAGGDACYFDNLRINGISYTNSPTDIPTAPTASPTSTTIVSTLSPTPTSTAVPTMEPTAEPTSVSTIIPTSNPTSNPTMDPTAEPTSVSIIIPTSNPTMDPTAEPTSVAAIIPTQLPTSNPTFHPSQNQIENPLIPTNDPLVSSSVHISLYTTTFVIGTSFSYPANPRTAYIVVLSALIILVMILFLIYFRKQLQRKRVHFVENETVCINENNAKQCVVPDMHAMHFVNLQSLSSIEDIIKKSINMEEDDKKELGLIYANIGNLRNMANGENEMKRWLSDIGKWIYYNNFVNNGFRSLALLKGIESIQDLEAIGIVSAEDQFTIMDRIHRLKREKLKVLERTQEGVDENKYNEERFEKEQHVDNESESQSTDIGQETCTNVTIDAMKHDKIALGVISTRKGRNETETSMDRECREALTLRDAMVHDKIVLGVITTKQ